MQNDIQDFLKAGNDILNSVSSAIDRNDYSTLHADVNKAIKSVHVDRRTTYSSRGTVPANGHMQTNVGRSKIFSFF